MLADRSFNKFLKLFMPKFKFHCTLFVLFISMNMIQSKSAIAQGTGYGGSVIYNFMTEGIGIDLRARIPVANRLFLVPEVSYFPGFNTYHEYLAAGALHYNLLQMGNYDLYLAGGAYYNNWLNVDDFTFDDKQQHNFSPQGGAGIIRSVGCLRPFIENRYDFKWKENNARIGLMFYPGSCGRGKEKCPPPPNK